MCRTFIRGFHEDAEGEWVAELACGHAQHLRHRRPSLPAGLAAYKRTATFTEETVPIGLLRDHRTKPGVWAKFVVAVGRLEYTLDSPPRAFMLTPGSPGVAPPIAPHHLTENQGA